METTYDTHNPKVYFHSSICLFFASFINAYYLYVLLPSWSAGPAYLIPSSHPMRLELWDPHFTAEVTAQSN